MIIIIILLIIIIIIKDVYIKCKNYNRKSEAITRNEEKVKWIYLPLNVSSRNMT